MARERGWQRQSPHSPRNGKISALNSSAKIFAVAPMMEWTDRHCRYFHRRLTRRALLYTEMITTAAVLHRSEEHTSELQSL